MNEDPRRVVVQKCNALIVGDDLTCASCGRAVAQYPAKRPDANGDRPLVWEHRRGAVIGQTQTLRMAVAAAEARAVRAERQLEEQAELLDDAYRLQRIEEKLDELLSRPVGDREWKPNHRRHVDGGVPIRQQRKERRHAVGAQGPG